MKQHEHYMEIALQQAETAFALGEVPIGAVIVIGSDIVCQAHNMKEQWKDATAHAEMIALKEAVKMLGHWRYLSEATLYVTLEPCPMCAGAIVQSRIRKLVYGADDPKAGAAGSLMNIVQDPRLNHRLEVVAGILKEGCGKILSDFFRKRRDSL